jgi:hypothetical protein
MNNPLFTTTPKNGDPTSMSIHEITHEDGNFHFGKVLIPKVAFEDRDVHILEVFINVVELPIFTPKRKKARKSMWWLNNVYYDHWATTKSIGGQDDNG